MTKPSFNQTFAVEQSKSTERHRLVGDPNHFGIDQGPVVLMIENFRSDLVWDIMRRRPTMIAGLRRARFTGSRLDRQCRWAYPRCESIRLPASPCLPEELSLRLRTASTTR